MDGLWLRLLDPMAIFYHFDESDLVFAKTIANVLLP